MLYTAQLVWSEEGDFPPSVTVSLTARTFDLETEHVFVTTVTAAAEEPTAFLAGEAREAIEAWLERISVQLGLPF